MIITSRQLKFKSKSAPANILQINCENSYDIESTQKAVACRLSSTQFCIIFFFYFFFIFINFFIILFSDIYLFIYLFIYFYFITLLFNLTLMKNF